MITTDQLKECPLIRIVSETKDEVIFEIDERTGSGKVVLEIICPTVKGRLQFKGAKIQTVGTEARDVPSSWRLENIEGNLDAILNNYLAIWGTVQSASPAEQPQEQIPDFTQAEELIRQAAKAFIEALGPKGPSAYQHSTHYLSICNEALLTEINVQSRPTAPATGDPTWPTADLFPAAAGDPAPR